MILGMKFVNENIGRQTQKPRIPVKYTRSSVHVRRTSLYHGGVGDWLSLSDIVSYLASLSSVA